MTTDTSNPNIEWKKKKGFDNKERLSLRVDVRKALKQEAEDKKSVSGNNVPRPAELPKGLKKIRKKIKDIYDDEEEDENDYILSPLDLNNSLFNALQEDEKRQLQQQKTIQTIDSLQNAGKAASIAAANKVSKDLGLKGLNKKIINKNMLDASSGKTYENTLKDELSAKAKIKGRNLSEKETVNLLRGIKKIQIMAEAADTSKLRAIEGWKIEELVDAGQKDSDEKKIAEKILEKSGRKKDGVTVKKITKKARTQSKSAEKEPLKKSDFQR